MSDHLHILAKQADGTWRCPVCVVRGGEWRFPTDAEAAEMAKKAKGKKRGKGC